MSHALSLAERERESVARRSSRQTSDHAHAGAQRGRCLQAARTKVILKGHVERAVRQGTAAMPSTTGVCMRTVLIVVRQDVVCMRSKGGCGSSGSGSTEPDLPLSSAPVAILNCDFRGRECLSKKEQ